MKSYYAAPLSSFTLPAVMLLVGFPLRCRANSDAVVRWSAKSVVVTEKARMEKQSAAEYNMQAERLVAEGKIKAALEKYKVAIALQPTSLDMMWALIERGDIYRDRKQWDKASADYNHAAAVGDVVSETVRRKEQVSFNALRGGQGNIKEFHDWRKASMQLGLAINRMEMGKARVLLFTNRTQAALDALHDLTPRVHAMRSLAFGSPPPDEPRVELPDLWPQLNVEVVRGEVLIALGRYQEALVDLNAGLRHEPRVMHKSASRYAELYFNRGRAYNGLGQKDKALADFNIAVKLDPAYKVPLKNTSYARELTPRDPSKADEPLDLSETAAAYVLRGEEESARTPAYSDAAYYYGKAIALDATFAAAYEGRARAYAAVANGNTDSRMYQFDVYVAESNARAKPEAALTQAERDAKEERSAKMFAELEETTRAISQRSLQKPVQRSAVPIKPKVEPIPAEKRAEYNAKALADFNRAVALEPNEPRWLKSRLAFEKATPAYAGSVASDEKQLATLYKDLAARKKSTPEVILPLWKVKS